LPARVVPRSRAGWRWIDGVDTAIGEEREAYRVMLLIAGVPRRVADLTEARFVVAPAERVAGAVVKVRQIGTGAASAPATICVPTA
jgi:hypothetical protein